jgi:hypothetical protein
MRRTLFGGLCGILTLLKCSSDAELFNGNNPSELGESDGPGVTTVGDWAIVSSGWQQTGDGAGQSPGPPSGST